MLNENATKWVEALRSGDYRQGYGQLRSSADEFCCLGVACDVYEKETGHILLGRSASGCYHYADAVILLPHLVMKWLGLRDMGGSYFDRDVRGVTTALTTNNDTHTPFDEIADIIESEPEDLFV